MNYYKYEYPSKGKPLTIGITEDNGKFTVYGKKGKSEDRYQFAFEVIHNAEADSISKEEFDKLVSGFDIKGSIREDK